MKNISFKIEEELHKDFKLVCVMNDRQIKERLIELIKKDIEESKNKKER